MPYKIYTYEDPYQLDQTDFWDEICALPHFCVSRTLVNGFKDVIQESIKGLICPLDDLVSHEKVYKSWTDNISLRIQQYSTLTSIFKGMLFKGEIDKNFHMALMQNQTQFLEAIRLFVELGISATALDDRKANKEQRLFISVLRDIQTNGSRLFKFPDTPCLTELKEIITALAENELKESDEKKGNLHSELKDRLWYDRAIKNTRMQDLTTIIVHGVHQFSPPQLRLLIDMERMGLTIIFLFNYQQRFSEIYSSWKYIYQCFETHIHHDANIKEYRLQSMQNQSNALAMALGELCEGHYNSIDRRFRQWYQLYKNTELREFANITEYAHFISDHFDAAITNYHNAQGVIDRGNRVWDHAAVLRHLNEQVYTANRDVHTLLKIYYPEYSKDRHFLAYPIGQFFSAIYRLWNYERGEINMDVKAIKECLSSRILSSGRAEELLRTYYNLQILFESVSSFEEFEARIKTEYIACYNRATSAHGTDPIAPIKQLSIYNKYKIKKSDIVSLIRAIEELNEIAVYLFSIGNTHEDYINFGKHFQNLEDFIKQRQLDLANEEERALIDALQQRLDKIKPSQSTFSGTFRDLREGLHFYLKQKDDDNGVDWIIKNFEQIDGDILQSKKQFERGEKKVYHFACISDRDLSCPIDNLLPWPLTDFFIRKAYSPIDLQFQVYYSSICERGGFLRYALFYGLCFNRCDMRLSYVKQYGDETTEPYSLLSVLGITSSYGILDATGDKSPFKLTITQIPTSEVRYDQYEMMSMFLCPYKFFLDYVMSDSPIIQGDFLYQKFYENLLIESVWKRIAGKPKEMVLNQLEQYISNASANFKQFFAFWKQTEVYDLEIRAKNYFVYEIINKSPGKIVKIYDESHMRTRWLFGSALFEVDISDTEPQNPYKAFEGFSKSEFPKKRYSLHSLPKPDKRVADTENANVLRQTVKQYLNQSPNADKFAVPSDWCTYCVNRCICLESFLMVE